MDSRTSTSKAKAQEELQSNQSGSQEEHGKRQHNYVETLAEEAQTAANSGNINQLWKAIQKLKNEKAAGLDNTPAEAFKEDENTTVEMY